MSQPVQLFAVIALVSLPTVMYGGYALLRLLKTDPDEFRRTYFRAGHAHAGVLVILSLVIQVLLDHALLPPDWLWVTRVAAPVAAILVAGGFFGIAFSPRLRSLLYAGALLVSFATVATGVGLIRA